MTEYLSSCLVVNLFSRNNQQLLIALLYTLSRWKHRHGITQLEHDTIFFLMFFLFNYPVAYTNNITPLKTNQ